MNSTSPVGSAAACAGAGVLPPFPRVGVGVTGGASLGAVGMLVVVSLLVLLTKILVINFYFTRTCRDRKTETV